MTDAPNPIGVRYRRRRRRPVRLFVAAVIVVTCEYQVPAFQDSSGPGQGASDSARQGQIEQILEEEAARARTLEQPAMPSLDRLGTLDGETQKAYVGALREYWEYQIAGYRHRRTVFEWQLVASKIIFVAVISLVAGGVFFSGVQFFRAPRPTTAARPQADDSPEPRLIEFDASLEGIRVKSSVLGVVILAISLAFFYLYLRYVYPVVDTF